MKKGPAAFARSAGTRELPDPDMERLGEVEADDGVFDAGASGEAIGVQVEGNADVLVDLAAGMELTVNASPSTGR